MDSQFINFICFNVAGNRFTTTKETILREPASRLALIARGVLPVNRDDTGAIFLDRDAKHFQLVLNYLRDGWCSLPKSQDERRELLQEIRYYQLPGMEAWMRTQDINGEAALRPQSANPYTSYARESPTSAAAHAYCSNAETSPAPAGYRLNASYSLPTSPIRSSFVNGPNGDLLTAAFGVRASLSPEAASSPAAAASLRWLASQAGRPESAGVSSMGLQLSPIPPVARPSSAAAAAYMGGMVGPVDAAAGFAAGFTAGATAERRSLSLIDGCGATTRPSAIHTSIDAAQGLAGRNIPAPLPNDGFKWTSRYLQSNTKMQQVVETLLELAFIAPHPSLHAGKSTISVSSECDHDRVSSFMGSAGLGVDSGRFRYQVVRIHNSTGWSFELSLKPSSDLAVYDKYNVAEYIQDNFFVLTAVMKDQYGVMMEEDNSNRPKCVACKRNHVAVTLQKSCNLASQV